MLFWAGLGIALFGLQEAAATGGAPPYVMYTTFWKGGGASICLQYDLDFSSPNIDLYANCSLVAGSVSQELQPTPPSLFYARKSLLVYTQCRPDTNYCDEKRVCWGPNVGGNRTLRNYGCSDWSFIHTLTAVNSGNEEVAVAWRGSVEAGGYTICSLTGIKASPGPGKLECIGVEGSDINNLVAQRNLSSEGNFLGNMVLYTDTGRRQQPLVCSFNISDIQQRSCIDAPTSPFLSSPVLTSQENYAIYTVPNQKVCVTGVSMASPTWDCLHLPKGMSPLSPVALIDRMGKGHLSWISHPPGSKSVELVHTPLPLANSSISTSAFQTGAPASKVVDTDLVVEDFGAIITTVAGPVLCHTSRSCTKPMKGWTLSNVVTLDYGYAGYFFEALSPTGDHYFCRHMVQDFATKPPSCTLAQGPLVASISAAVGWQDFNEGYPGP